MIYLDQVKLAQAHLETARVQAQSALRLLSAPTDGHSLDEVDYERVAIVAAVGGRCTQVIEDINAQVQVRDESLELWDTFADSQWDSY